MNVDCLRTYKISNLLFWVILKRTIQINVCKINVVMEQFIQLIDKIVIHKLVEMEFVWKIGRARQGLRFWLKRTKM